MGNIAVLGACVRLLLPDGLELLEQAIAFRMGAAGRGERRRRPRGLRRGARGSTRLAGDTPVEPAPEPARPPRSATSSSRSARPTRCGNHTGSWSLDRPVLTDACTACAVCALFCPEGAIARHDGAMAIDYLYCKGCGICEVVCPVRDAIAHGGGEGVSDAAARAGRADGRRGGRVRRHARAGAGDRLLPDHAADDHRRAARRARRRPRRRRVREPRERALDVRLRDRRRAGGRPDVHGDVVAGPPLRARAAPPRLARARAARRWSTSTARSSPRGASSPTSPTA